VAISYNNVSVRFLPDDETPFDESLGGKSVFFTAAFSLNLAVVIVPAAPDLKKDESLGELWHDIKPDNGVYTVDIATILPYYLPSFDGKPEHAFRVGGSELVVSSRMTRCFFSESQAATDELQYYLCHLLAVRSLREQRQFDSFHPVPLRSFIAKRFQCQAEAAERMVQQHFPVWLDQFVREISALIDAVRTASPRDAKHLLPQLSTPSLPIFWVSIEGADGKRGIQQFGGDVSVAAFRSLNNLDAQAVTAVDTYLRSGAKVPVHESSLALSHTFCHYGYLGLALVQVCVACESVLAEAYRQFLTARGVSNHKYHEQKRDITFSQLLNLHLASMRDLRQLPNHDNVLSTLNWARRCRNDVVHEGALQQIVSPAEVANAINAAETLVNFINGNITEDVA
jgi:hypothetical protein